MIRISHLRKEYPTATPLQDVSVEIKKGDIISVIGPSGTGKSTLIRCLNLLEKPTSGEIWLGDECITDPKCNISKIRQRMGMVFQSFNLFQHLCVIENIMAAPMALLGKTKQQAYDDGMKLLRMVGLADKALNYPDVLSGGQKQRVAIARTLAMEPEIILFDEPTSALDPTMVGEVQAVIKDLARKGLTMIIVTHEMRFAKEIANRVFYMDEGGIYEDGTPEQIFEHPQKIKTARFVRRIKVLENLITSKDFDFLGFNSDLEAFGRRSMISQRTIHRTQAAFEELIMQILLPALPERFRLLIEIEYAQDDELVTMLLKYTGEYFDPLTTDNQISLKIALNAAEYISYTQLQEDEWTNQVAVQIR